MGEDSMNKENDVKEVIAKLEKKRMTLKQAKTYIENIVEMEVTDVSKSKWMLKDHNEEDFMWLIQTDEELIDYAEEQKEAIEG